MLRRNLLFVFGAMVLVGLAWQPRAVAQDGEFCKVEMTLVSDGGIAFIDNYFTTDIETTGDGKASPGEVLQFKVKVKNNSPQRLISTSAKATCSEAACVLSMPSEASKNKTSRPGDMVLPELAPGAEVVKHFWLGVPNTVAIRDNFVVTLTVGESGLNPVKTEITVPMVAAVATSTFKAPVIDNLKFDDDTFGDSDGDGNGLPSPDERIELRMNLRNSEKKRMSEVEVIVRSSNISFSETRKTFAELPADDPNVAATSLDFAGHVKSLPADNAPLAVEITVLGKLETVDAEGKVVSKTDSSWTYTAMLSVTDPNGLSLKPGVLEALASYVDSGSALHAIHAWARTFNVLNYYEFQTALSNEHNAIARQGGDPALLAEIDEALKTEADAMANTETPAEVLAALTHNHQMFAMSAFGKKSQWGGIWSAPSYVREVDPFGLEGLSESSLESVSRKGLRWTPRTSHLLLASIYGVPGWKAIAVPQPLKDHSYIKEALAATLGSVVQPNVLVRQGKDTTLVTVSVARGVGALGAATLKVMFLCSPDYSQCRLLFTHAKDYAVKVQREE
ncbi:MAG: hypothetical protein IT462_02800 [Planctomycetes bacterium]|nr:hypothetical protein [Planctomycetota bacterium]